MSNLFVLGCPGFVTTPLTLCCVRSRLNFVIFSEPCCLLLLHVGTIFDWGVKIIHTTFRGGPLKSSWGV